MVSFWIIVVTYYTHIIDQLQHKVVMGVSTAY
jgi:hypothetical protein